MNKVSLVTIWVDPKTYQILQYTFDDIDMDFVPGRALPRVSDLKATMRMSQAFPEVWMPRSIEMHFGMMMAVRPVGLVGVRRLRPLVDRERAGRRV